MPIKKVHKLEGAAFKAVKKMRDMIAEKEKAYSDLVEHLQKEANEGGELVNKAITEQWAFIQRELGFSDSQEPKLHLETKYEVHGFYLVEENDEVSMADLGKTIHEKIEKAAAEALKSKKSDKGEKCPGCGQVHEPRVIEIDLREVRGDNDKERRGPNREYIAGLMDKLFENAPEHVREAWERVKISKKFVA